MLIKEYDVYEFTGESEEIPKRLVVHTDEDGNIYLSGSYSKNDTESKKFSIDEVLEVGKLVFDFTMDDMLLQHDDLVRCRREDLVCYDDKDVVIVKSSLEVFNKYYIIKGAERSVNKMKEELQSRINMAECKQRCLQNAIKVYKEKLEKVENGDTTITI